MYIIDKILHIYTGMICVSWLFPYIKKHSLIPCLLIAIGKEILDITTKIGSYEILDIVFTLLGGVIVLITIKRMPP